MHRHLSTPQKSSPAKTTVLQPSFGQTRPRLAPSALSPAWPREALPAPACSGGAPPAPSCQLPAASSAKGTVPCAAGCCSHTSPAPPTPPRPATSASGTQPGLHLAHFCRPWAGCLIPRPGVQEEGPASKTLGGRDAHLEPSTTTLLLLQIDHSLPRLGPQFLTSVSKHTQSYNSIHPVS